jgi:chemotaxis protein CheD
MNTPRQSSNPPRIVHTLHPGDVVCAERGVRLETLLGSCVAIVLTDKRRTLGAMCHIVHCRPAKDPATDSSACAEIALGSLYARLRSHGFRPQLCEAYVYGGGNMFPKLSEKSHVGADNSQWALERLALDGVRVLHHDVGGNAYRRVAWTVGSHRPDVVAVAV